MPCATESPRARLGRGLEMLKHRGALSEKRTQGTTQALPSARYLLKLGDTEDHVTAFIVRQLQEQGLHCTVDKSHVIVSADDEKLKLQAERQKWMKPLKESEEIAAFRVADESQFEPSDGDKLFSSAECSLLLYHSIQCTPYSTEVFKGRQYSTIDKHKGLLTALQLCRPPVIDEAYPLHDGKECKALSSMLLFSLLPTKPFDVTHIRNYFGEEVAFYFGWMCFYMSFICVPVVIGLAMYLLRPAGVTVDTDPYLPLFSVIMALWGVLFLVLWQRRSSSLSFAWSTYSLSPSVEVRPEYHGSPATDPVTRKPTVYYPGWKRRLWYVFSVLAMLPLLSLGVAAMTLSLNLNGYVKSTESPIYVESMAKFAQPGGLFAADSPYFLWLVPTLAHSICVSIINMMYSRVAVACTDLENHRTMRGWHNSLVVKRVFFECFDCFMPLFYIAFYQLDVITLKMEIVSLFMSDEIRRVAVETIVPLAQQFLVGRVKHKKGKPGHIPDTILAEYDQFDDYLEMVIQFGYITLFASAFPLGAAVTYIFLCVEIRSDLFKLLRAYRRPLPRRVRDIGVWFDVMQVMVFAAILTNCFILGFSSEQLMQWTPWLYSRETADGDQIMAMGSGRYVVGVVFGFEHLLLVLALWLRWAIHPVPKKVRLAIARREYLAEHSKGGGRDTDKNKRD